MLELRLAIVVETGRHDSEPGAAAGPGAPAPDAAVEQRLVVELVEPASETAGERSTGIGRQAVCDVALMGRARAGDRVIVNTAALDLGLGSGGFDIVHANLTRLSAAASGAIAGAGATPPHRDGRPHVMKLNYTSLQHAVEPVESGALRAVTASGAAAAPAAPAAVLALHGQLAAVAWAFARAAPGRSLGYIQTPGGALSGARSRTVRRLRERGLLAGHITAGAAFGGEAEAMTTAGALHHGLATLGWDAAVCGPGPGIVGSASALGHGGMAALDSAHVALALGCPTLVVARMSAADARARHRPLSHHTLTVLDLLLEPVTVALPAGIRSPVGADLRAGLGDVFASPSRPPAIGAAVERPARLARHDWRRAAIDLPGFAASGLAAPSMGRGVAEDPLFFGAALAAGAALAELLAGASDAAGVKRGAGELDPVGAAEPA